jgi:hypothetical protein
MYVATIPNRGSPPAVLLRESYREDGKVKNRTLANLSHWPETKVDALRRALKGLPAPVELEGAFEIARSLPHGHVAAVLGTLRDLGLDELIDHEPSRTRRLAVALVVASVIGPCSKLAMARGLRHATASSSLGAVLEVSGCDEDDLYQAMDYLVARQGAIEDGLARCHLHGGTLVLYDVSSAAFEGQTCPIAAIGHPRDGVHGRKQIVYGVLTNTRGVPVAIEVFKGNTGDPKTVASQVKKLKERFGLERVCLVGDRGMLTSARLREDLVPAELDWITALRAPQIKKLVETGAIQPSLFDERDMFEITHPDYPAERLVACKNPFLAVERAAKREQLLLATEAALGKIADAVRRDRRPLRGKDTIALRVGREINRYKVAKHFVMEISDDAISFRRTQERITAEAALDGIYVVRTSLTESVISSTDTVERYKALEGVERVFRGLNTTLLVRPIRHRLEERVRAHVFLRMLAYYVIWHMQERLAPMLFKDENLAQARADRASPVAPARRSGVALRKIASKRTEDGLPVHSFESLLEDLATICANRIEPIDRTLSPFTMVTSPTPVQRRAFELLGVSHRSGYA